MSTGMPQWENLYEMTPARKNLARVVASSDDLLLIERLRSCDEAAFVSLVDRYHTTMIRLAMVYVTALAVSEEVVQETWVGILEGLHRFEGRSWIGGLADSAYLSSHL